jgi:hypothetical protein
MTEYLLDIDEQYDKQAAKLRDYITHTLEAKVYARRLYVYYVETQARVTIAESREFALAKALRTAEECHARATVDCLHHHLANRRLLAIDGQEPAILDGIPVHPPL